MNRNSVTHSVQTKNTLPIEEKYQADIQNWIDEIKAKTGLPAERIVTEVFLSRMSTPVFHPYDEKENSKEL